MNCVCVCAWIRPRARERGRRREVLAWEDEIAWMFEVQKLRYPPYKNEVASKVNPSSWVCSLGREIEKRDGDLGLLCLSL